VELKRRVRGKRGRKGRRKTSIHFAMSQGGNKKEKPDYARIN
jgi:hypothetical protein